MNAKEKNKRGQVKQDTLPIPSDELGIGLEKGNKETLKADQFQKKETAKPKRVNPAIRQRKELYSNLIEALPEVIFVLSLDGRILSLNKAFERITGWSRNEWVGKAFSPLIHPRDVKLAMKKFQQTLRKKTPPAFHLRVQSKSGGYLIAEFLCTPQIQGGEVIAIIGTAHDITKRMRAEDLLRKAKTELEIRLRERTQELNTINKKLEREIAERKRAEVALKEKLSRLSTKSKYETIISAVTRSVHQSISLEKVLENAVTTMNENIDKSKNVCIYLVEGKEAVMKAHRGLPDWFIQRAGRIPYPKGFTWKTIIEGKPVYCADIDRDDLIGPAGRDLGTKSYLSIPIQFEGMTVGALNIHSMKGNAFDEEDINLLQIVAQQIGVAINNAKQAGALRESEERYRALYENNPSMCFTLDVQGRVLSVNRYGLEQLGYARKDLVGQSVLNIFHEDDHKAVLEQMDYCLKNRGAVSYWEFRKVRKQGDVMWVREAARSMQNVDGNTVILLVCEDITERKRAVEQIKASLREKDVLLKEIHHRVKNNLQIIYCLLDLQSQHVKDKKTLQMFNDTCSRVRSMALIHEKLYQSKDLGKIDFGEYILSLADYLIQSYGVNADPVSLRADVEEVYLDVDTAISCGMIVNELVSNSLKHAFTDKTEGKKEINISLYSRNNKLTLRVSDNGVGFPSGFNFKKTESLGLQLVNALTSQLDGTISFNRRPRTEFRITFHRQKHEQRGDLR